MNYEQKYKEALERARKIENGEPLDVPDGTHIPVAIFPELKESDDEQTRKELIDFVKSRLAGFPQCEKYISWLEKQNDANKEYWRGYREGKQEILDKYAELEKKCEQKSVDKVEPKFKVGDWISDGNITIQIEAIKNNCYSYCGDCTLYSIKTADKVYHLWTIKDAKDGDVLATKDNRICIFDNTVEEGKYPFAYCGLSIYGFEVYDRTLPFTHLDVYPATKEQRDKLEEAMIKAGYKWDADKKELIKL